MLNLDDVEEEFPRFKDLLINQYFDLEVCIRYHSRYLFDTYYYCINDDYRNIMNEFK